MKGWMRAVLWVTAILAVLVGLARYLFFDTWRVPDDVNDPHNWANAPSLEPGDTTLIFRVGEMHVGDVVRCLDPSADPPNSKWIVARVIGIAGDKLEMQDNRIRINNYAVKALPCLGLPRKVVDANAAEVQLDCQGEEVGSSRHDTYTSSTSTAFLETVVPVGKLFLMSDNRATPWAHDSREPEVGSLPVEACKDKVLLRLWSKAGWSDGQRRMTFLF